MLIEAAQASEIRSHLVPSTEKRGLSERPYEVLQMRHLGKSTREIQRELWISEATVRSHDRTITAWYGAKTYSEAVAVARQRGDV
ncbi:LuxR C-terminal-related transcriptional regulator [Rubrobacter aplysinae]|uniref:LuxR C-terminal-related transcriptional regulator n=1 Tax=Rubrobacter aplysinae TaxID=909625 RepID=UPI001364D0AC